MLALYLSEPLSQATVLALSSVIADNKSSCYRSFQTAEHPLNHGELTWFVIQMLEFIRIAQDLAICIIETGFSYMWRRPVGFSTSRALA